MKLLTTKGIGIEIDDEDFDLVGHLNWHVNSYGYAVAYKMIKCKKYLYFMHRLITNCPAEMEVDHINRNRLDNTKANLRIVSHHQNLMNKSIYKNNRHGFKGVTTKGKRFRATIRFEGKKIHLGYFGSAIDAAKAYDNAARKYFNDFAVLNF